MPLMTGGKAVVECLAYGGTNAYDNLCFLCGAPVTDARATCLR